MGVHPGVGGGAIERPEFSEIRAYTPFQVYGEDAGDSEIKALVKVVDAYGSQIPNLYAAMKDADTPVEERAHLTVTTAHKAKGLEWDQVHLTNDFIDVNDLADGFDPEEINLLYVAATRAVRAIRLPDSLADWLNNCGFSEPTDAPRAASVVQDKPATEAGGEPQGIDTNQVVRAWLVEHARRLSESTAIEVRAVLDDLQPAMSGQA